MLIRQCLETIEFISRTKQSLENILVCVTRDVNFKKLCNNINSILTFGFLLISESQLISHFITIHISLLKNMYLNYFCFIISIEFLPILFSVLYRSKCHVRIPKLLFSFIGVSLVHRLNVNVKIVKIIKTSCGHSTLLCGLPTILLDSFTFLI